MPKRFGPEKCPVYLRVPWIGKASIGLDKNVKTAVESCYGSVTTRVVFTSKRMLPVARKDVLPTTMKNCLINQITIIYRVSKTLFRINKIMKFSRFILMHEACKKILTICIIL